MPTDRNVYVAAHVTKETKDALQRAADRQRVSVSKFISQAVEEKLGAEQELVETE